jgi:hypothetical protein
VLHSEALSQKKKKNEKKKQQRKKERNMRDLDYLTPVGAGLGSTLLTG